jgi:biotin transport system substrate-specific component
MSNLTLAAGRPTLADRFFARSIVTDTALVVAGAALTAGAAQLAIPMWPVPITGQTFAVLFVGTVLGATRGGISLGLYALLGLVGLPVYSGSASGWSVLAGPTGGYIIGFVLAAILTGWLAQRQWDRRFVGMLVSFLAGSFVIYAVALPWLAFSLGRLGAPNDLSSVLKGGLYPFILGDTVKALIAAALVPLVWKVTKPRPKSAIKR